MTNQGKLRILKLVSSKEASPLTLDGVSKQTLGRVLEYLRENDRLFDYNVPEAYRNTNRGHLQEFLVKTYSQKNFEITEDRTVERYIQPYDFVELDDGPAFEYRFFLEPGMRGVIKKVDISKEYPLEILWKPSKEFPEKQELIHKGIGLSLLPKGPFKREKISSKIELLAEATPGRLVEMDRTSVRYLYHVPVGAKGIVTEIEQFGKFPVSVIFGNTKGHLPTDTGIICCKYSILKLIRENKINIRKLIREL